MLLQLRHSVIKMSCFQHHDFAQIVEGCCSVNYKDVMKHGLIWDWDSTGSSSGPGNGFKLTLIHEY